MTHISDEKKGIVAELKKLISEYPIIGAVNMEGLPASQLQKMRATLRGKVILTMTKRRLMKIAIAASKEKKQGIEKIEQYLIGMPALIFTKDNPFELYKILKKSKSKAPAKAGQTAPTDIVVKAGPTGFAPGPIIGELGAVGIKCGVEGGKIAIKQDSVVVKEGQKISSKQAEILTRLGIQPMEVGLDLVATYENGVIFTKSILNIDEEEFMRRLQTAARWAVNLSVDIAFPTKDNINLLIGKAFNDAKAVGLERNIIDEGIIDELIARAERQILGIKSAGNIQVPEKTTEKKTKILEEEKKIMAEEKVIEKQPKPVVEAPIEAETRQAVKEEEEKELEQERIEKEKEFENTDKKVEEIVKKIKAGKGPSAKQIVEEVKSEYNDYKDDEMKKTEELAQKLLREGTLR